MSRRVDRFAGWQCASACLLAVALPQAVAAQGHDSTAIDRRAGQVVAMIGGATLSADSIFAPAFLAQFSATQLGTLFTSIRTQLGNVSGVERLTVAGDPATHAVFKLSLSVGATRAMTLDIDAAPPHRVSGLLFGLPPVANLAALIPEFRALPGQLSFLAARIDSGKLTPLAAIDSNRALALGSAFKLYILAELIREVASGARH